MLDERLKEVKTWFRNHGYISKKVKPEIETVKTMKKTDFLSKHKKEINNIITLV